MKEACRFYSLLLPLRQHEKLVALSRKTGLPLAKLIRQGIDRLLENPKCKCSEVNGND